jgi:hypothetical protein
MSKVPVWGLLLCSLAAQAADDVTARKNFGTELARCSVYYSATAGAPGLNQKQHDDLQDKANTAMQQAMRVTSSEFAITANRQAQAHPEEINGAVCEQVMAHPNERFAYWRGR